MTDAFPVVSRDGLTNGIQLSIDNGGDGFRISGPKFSGTSHEIKRAKIDASATIEIRRHLDAAFPPEAKA